MKAEKTLLIDALLKRVNASPFLFVVDYTGLTVDKFTELRKRLRGAGAEIHVFKNSLVKKAAEKAGYPGDLGASLTGQTAVVTGEKDVCAAAKIMKTFADEFEKPQMKAGVLDGRQAGAPAQRTRGFACPRAQGQGGQGRLNTQSTNLIRWPGNRPEPETSMVPRRIRGF